MKTPDMFEDLARYYDPLMSHVNYDRWFTIALALGELLPSPPRYLDAACGTGTLAGMLRQAGWDATGLDLSPAMVREGRRKVPGLPLAVADLRALPVAGAFDLVTCLFDSLNFLLADEDLGRALTELHGALCDGGILYADIITERMVTDHFEGQEWVESNKGFKSRWASSYDKREAMAESCVQINSGNVSSILERVYDLDVVKKYVESAGFQILGVFDADHWKAPRKKSTRIDIVAVKNGAAGIERRFLKTAKTVRELVYGG